MCDQVRDWGLVFALYRALHSADDPRRGFHSRCANDNIDAATGEFMQRVAEALLRRRCVRTRPVRRMRRRLPSEARR